MFRDEVVEDAPTRTAGDDLVDVEKEDCALLGGDDADLTCLRRTRQGLGEAPADGDLGDQGAIAPEVVAGDVDPSLEHDAQLTGIIPLLDDGTIASEVAGPPLQAVEELGDLISLGSSEERGCL